MNSNIDNLRELVSSKRIPVFIGVGGHRDLRTRPEDVKAMKSEIKLVLKRITSGYHHTEFIILTSLAAGADQIITETAIEEGYRFGVVLPMPEDVYLARTTKKESGEVIPNFTESDKAKFYELKNSDKCVFVYTMPVLDNGDPANRSQFIETMRFISDNSFAGIELWDGKLKGYSSAGAGSTIRDAMHGKSYLEKRFHGLTIPETRPIYHIYAPREDDNTESEYFYKHRELYPEPLLETGTSWFGIDPANPAAAFETKHGREYRQRRAKVAEVLKWIDIYNDDVTKRKNFIAIQQKKYRLSDGLDKSVLTGKTNVCDIYFSASDAMALFYQNRRARLGILIILLACVGYMCLNIFSDLIGTSFFSLAAYAVMMFSALLALRYVTRKRLHGRFVSYRAIAEGLRVQLYWYAAGIIDDKESKNEALVQDYYLRRQKGHIDWIRSAIRSINLLAEASTPDCAEVTPAQLKNISDIWIGRMDIKNPSTGEWEAPVKPLTDIRKISNNGQTGYYLSKIINPRSSIVLPKGAAKDAARISPVYKKKRNIKIVTMACVFLSSLLAFLLAGVIGIFGAENNLLARTPVLSFDLQSVIIFLIGALPLVSLLLKSIADFMGYSDDLDRYTWYYRLFKRAMTEIDIVYRNENGRYGTDALRADGIKEKLFEIGKEALVENADWVMINEKREPEIPEN